MMGPRYLAIRQIIIPNIELEIIYALIVVLLCLFIYVQTKDLYKLTSHKGIQFFRNSFLFLGIAFAFRVLYQFVILTDIRFEAPALLAIITSFVYVYASSLAILSLAYSASWKHFNFKDYHVYLIALIFPIIVILTRSPLLLIITQILLFIIAIAVSHHKKSSFSIIFLLLFLFWLLNIAATTIPNFLLSIKTAIYTISVILFGLIAYRILTRKKGSK